ncbi:hypothetical protein CEXT_95601 [Caerostris extrusa]|uniref:Uncharacterized protein n=1 Tax=Caerostris extrusa TaxID=172846 RepID=A0AAV4VFM8_CAEEX|nr:hypothetical protein CEXT_95601 [Caerostris extrusa]
MDISLLCLSEPMYPLTLAYFGVDPFEKKATTVIYFGFTKIRRYFWNSQMVLFSFVIKVRQRESGGQRATVSRSSPSIKPSSHV